MNIINQFSYLLIGAGVLLGSFIYLRQQVRASWPFVVVTQLAVAALFVIGFFLLRPGSSNVSDFDLAQSAIENGNPTFIEFYSNYCTGCIAVEPIVDRVVRDIEGEFDVLRVDIHTPVGREMRVAYGFSFTPEFVLFDGSGQEVWRDHIPPSSSQLDLARNIQ